jgi:hypothetical protein
MRTKGKTGSDEFHRLLAESRIRELNKHQMTSKEMKLAPRLVQTLKVKAVIRECGKVSNHCRQYIIWGPGIKYLQYMKEWGWL